MVCMLCKRKVAIMPKDTANEGSVDKQKWICGNIKQSCQSCRYCGVQFCAKNMARSLRGTLLELGHEARMIKENSLGVYEKFGMPGTTNGVNTDSLVMCDRCGANLSRLVVKTSKKQDEASSNAAAVSGGGDTETLLCLNCGHRTHGASRYLQMFFDWAPDPVCNAQGAGACSGRAVYKIKRGAMLCLPMT